MAIISGIVSQTIGSSTTTFQGWRVFVDFNGNGILDGNDLSSITNTSGAYSIDVLSPSPVPGTYEVRVQAPDGLGGFANPTTAGGGIWGYTNPTTYDPVVDDNFYLASFSTTQTVLGLVNFDDAAAPTPDRFGALADNSDVEAKQVWEGVGFNFINQANGSMFVEQTGPQSNNDTNGFVNDKLSGPIGAPGRVAVFDVSNEAPTGPSLGSYFLRAGGLQAAAGGGGQGNASTVPQLLIQYLNSGTNVVSGEIWDIDADGSGFERWKVEAFDTLTPTIGTDTPLDTIESGIGVSYWSNNGTGNTANAASLDGKAWTWNLDSTQEIKSVLITFTGSKPNAFVGLAFDNFQAYTYTTATPTTANFNLTKAESVPLPKTCFGGSEGTNDPTTPINGSWGAATFAYILRNGNTNTSSTTTFTDVVSSSPTTVSTVDPIQDSKDLGNAANLPVDAKGLGVGLVSTTNYLTSSFITNRNPEIQQGDQLRANFGKLANTAEIQLRLFLERESVASGVIAAEQMTYQLQKSDGSGGYTNVGGLVTVTADNNQSYVGKSGNNPGIPGAYTFTVNSSADFDTILFGGADYYKANSITGTRTDTSDYLLNKVCLTDFAGDGVNILSGAGSGKDFLYSSIADGGDTISDFGADDRIVIDLSGFGSGITSSNFSYAGGVLSFDQDGVTSITGSGANTNGYNNATDRVTLATLTGAPSSANLSFI